MYSSPALVEAAAGIGALSHRSEATSRQSTVGRSSSSDNHCTPAPSQQQQQRVDRQYRPTTAPGAALGRPGMGYPVRPDRDTAPHPIGSAGLKLSAAEAVLVIPVMAAWRPFCQDGGSTAPYSPPAFAACSSSSSRDSSS